MPDDDKGLTHAIDARRGAFDCRRCGRVTQHKETPGLGDYVEIKKDKNKARPWITQFNGMSAAQVPDREWKVKKDGGRLDSYAGATVSPRAVSKAVLKAVKWAEANRDRLFSEGVAK